VGRLSGVTVACLQGRSHAYEGHAATRIAVPIRTLHALGCRTLLLTNAAGSLHPHIGPGSLMLISDHINWAGVNPLIGPNDETLGPRFVDMTGAYDPALRQCLHEAARETGIELFEGVYIMVSGPNFETPAEIRAFARLGADAVGMSTVPECLVARHCGMRVAALSLITNLAAGLTGHKLGHAETLAVGAQAAAKLARLIAHALPKLAS
jgi:xanthosine phosphorylase